MASDGGRVMTTYCGELVKPGVGPGVLIAEMLQACYSSVCRSDTDVEKLDKDNHRL